MARTKKEEEEHDPKWLNQNLDSSYQKDSNASLSKSNTSSIHDEAIIMNEQSPLLIPNSPTVESTNDVDDDDDDDNPFSSEEYPSPENTKKILRPTCCHSIFILFSTYSSISLLFLLASQLSPLLFVKITGLHFYLRFYLAFFAFILFLVEVEFPYISASNSLFVDNWASRGILHSFLGLVNQEESLILSAQEQKKSSLFDGDDTEIEFILQLFVQITSYMMVISGVLYFLMGIFCLKGVKDKCQTHYKNLVEKEKQRLDILTSS